MFTLISDINHRRLIWLLTFVFTISVMLLIVYFISAQQTPRRQLQRPQMNPEEMMQRMLERIMERLNLSEEETLVLKPKVEEILKTRIEQNLEMRELTNTLREAINADDDAQIREKLELIKAKQKEHKEKAEKLEKELVGLLTLKQEAQLTVLGVVNSDGMVSGFGGFRGGRQPRPGSPQR